MLLDELATLRKKADLTQTEMAGEIGLSLRAYQDIETNNAQLRFIHVLAIERASLKLAGRSFKPDLALDPIRHDALAFAALFQDQRRLAFGSSPAMQERKKDMKDGIYVVHFEVPDAYGAGIAVMQAGRVQGGDSQMYYQGHYSWDGDDVTATLNVALHTRASNGSSVFGLDEFTLNMHGVGYGDGATFSATTSQRPGLQMRGTLRKLT